MTPEIFLENFGHLAGTPEAVKRLRELILQLAVQGKLLPRDPDDEPASVLLKKIAAEKARLVKEGKIRKPKPLPPIKPEEMPFALPEGWAWAVLQDCFLVVTDGDHQAPPKAETGVPFLVIGNVRQGELDFSNVRYVPREYYEGLDPIRQPTTGDLLYTVVGSLGIPVPVGSNKEFCVQRHIAILKSYSGSNCDFLHLLLRSSLVYEQAVELATGIAQKTLSLGSLRQIHVVMPPLAEQHRIVERVDQLMALCDQLEERETQASATHQALSMSALHALSTADGPDAFQTAWSRIRDHFDPLFITPESVKALRQTILQLAVMGKLVPQDPDDEPASTLLKKIAAEKARLVKEGKIRQPKPLPPIKPEEVPFELPEGWEWCNFADLMVFGPKNGYSPKAVEYETMVKSITLTAITSGAFNGEHFKYLDIEVEEESNLWLQYGDLLLQRANSLEYVGVSAIYTGDVNEFMYPDLIMKIRTSSQVSVEFAHLALLSSSLRDYMRKRATGTSGSMPKVNQATVNTIPVPLPPLVEQRRIVARVDQLMALCDRLEEQLQQSQTDGARLMEATVHHLSAA